LVATPSHLYDDEAQLNTTSSTARMVTPKISGFD